MTTRFVAWPGRLAMFILQSESGFAVAVTTYTVTLTTTAPQRQIYVVRCENNKLRTHSSRGLYHVFFVIYVFC